jgi:sugar phosphate isomerase/epimerase
MTLVLGIGFSSSVSEDPNFEQLKRNLDDATRLGVDFVELPVFVMDLIAGYRLLPSQLQRLRSALAGHDLRYTVHGPIAINFMQTGDAYRRHLDLAKATIELSAELGAAHLILHTGYIASNDEDEIEDAFSRQREAYGVLGEVAARHGLTIAVENIFVLSESDYTALPSRLAREIEAVGHPNVKACLDFSHAAITCARRGAPYREEVCALARVAKHLHVHDSFGDPAWLRTVSRSERVAYGLGDLHLPIGWGNLPWLEMMAECEFQPNVVFNLELPAPYWYALSDCVRALREMIRVYEEHRLQVA